MSKKTPAKEHKPKKPAKPVLAEPVPPPGHIPPPGQPMPEVLKPVNVASIREAVYARMAVSADPRVRLQHGMAAQQDALRRLIAAGYGVRDISAVLDDYSASTGEFMMKVFG